MSAAPRARRRRIAEEVVQTSAMDCGPAALKCLLEGHGIPVGYGRLREACQTDVDGTSIDRLEEVANDLGLRAEQRIVPVDHVLLTGAALWPAMAVVQRPGGATHFVVLWNRIGGRCQVMDPAVGRRWVPRQALLAELFRHEMSVPAADWREWVGSDDFLAALRARMRELGVPSRAARALEADALEDDGWFGMGALDASLRLVASVARGGGVRRGRRAAALLDALYRRTRAQTRDIFGIIAPEYWSAVPDPDSPDRSRQHLRVRGAVLLHVAGRADASTAAADGAAPGAPLSPELRAALDEPPARPLRTLGALLRADGLASPLALCGAIAIAVGGLLVEALLLRGAFDLASMLSLPAQRLAAALAMLAFVALLWTVRLPIASESMRLGRHLETRLRVALLAKLPRLDDRYFHSRPVSDMADRAHAIQQARSVPGLGLHLVQALFELALLVAGIAWLDAASAPWAVALAAVAIAVPLAAQPMLGERDLRARGHAGAMAGVYLDAMLGLAPVRAHRAQRAVSRLHEGLLAEWLRASRGLVRAAIGAEGVQALACTALAAGLVVAHFVRAGGVSGGDLLLVYWTLKLPGLGSQLAMLARQYPAQRNVMLRLIEPLTAPDAASRRGARRADAPGADRAPDAAARGGVRPAAMPGAVVDAAPSHAAPSRASPGRGAPAPSGPRPLPARGVRVRLRDARVVAAGHVILDEATLDLAPGEHAAVVGASGAGKSTLLGAMLGWHRLAEGTLSVDGIRVEAAVLEDLRRVTAWVDPGVQLWNRSLLDNLLYASADDAVARVGRVLDRADLRGVMRKLPDGLQAVLGEGGGRLSGGEGQRVRLARALLQPEVRLALLDEPFRGLDRGQRTRLLADTRAWWRDVTMLCVTHDVHETLAFDRVIVVADGRIVEDGPPRALAAADGAYRGLLEAEDALRAGAWGDVAWRRLEVRDGRVHDGGAPSRATPRPALGAVGRTR